MKTQIMILLFVLMFIGNAYANVQEYQGTYYHLGLENSHGGGDYIQTCSINGNYSMTFDMRYELINPDIFGFMQYSHLYFGFKNATDYEYRTLSHFDDGTVDEGQSPIYTISSPCSPGDRILCSSWTHEYTHDKHYYVDYYIIFTTASVYSISGNVTCADNVALYRWNTSLSTWEHTYNNTPYNDHYQSSIVDGEDYKLVIDDHEYEFSCTGNVIYDYDDCSNTILHLKDYCGYTMFGACSDIYMSDGGLPSSYELVDNYLWKYDITMSETQVPNGKMLDIFFDTDMGTHHEILYADGKEHDIFHPTKFWRMTFTVLDEDTLLPIEGAKIFADQTCTINPEHPLYSYLITDENGQGTFTGLSGGFFNFSIWATGYKIDRAFYGGYGHSAFVTDYYDIAYMNTSKNETFDPRNETKNITVGCYTFFTNENGIKTNTINDTDSLVYLNYSNSNCSATLKFQRLYGSYWMTKESYNIPALQKGSKTILNSNFSDYDACYRAYMYSYECDCNNTHPLHVLNKTVQEEQHYENLSAYCRFKNQLGGGQIDYREDVKISAYAYSNTSATLLNINLTLYDSSGVVATKACDWADFTGALPKWYYVWYPSVNYAIGENYTVVMTGYDGHNLSADEVWTSNIRNNKLTVSIKDNFDNPVTHATVFIEGWGSIAIGSNNHISISGLQDGDYQYKATKSGYITSGWDTITLTGDGSVTCVLVEIAETSVIGQKMSDADVKSIFIPLMYILFIFMILGAFKYANE